MHTKRIIQGKMTTPSLNHEQWPQVKEEKGKGNQDLKVAISLNVGLDLITQVIL